MSLAAHQLGTKPQERRRHQRVRVQLYGRYMLEDRREFTCQTMELSPGGLSVTAPTPGKVGERVVVYLDHLGRVEGRVARLVEGGFAIAFTATARKRDKLAAQLTWLANRHALGLPEDRRHERMVPRNPRGVLTLPEGRQVTVRIIDVSLSGAALSTELRLPVGAALTIGRTPARVVRPLEGGFAVEFVRQLPSHEQEDQVTG